MKLSDLIAYRNELARLDPAVTQGRARQDLAQIEFVAGGVSDFDDRTRRLERCNHSIQQAFRDYQTEFESLKRDVQARIDQESKYWFQESYRLFNQEMIHESTDYILDRRCVISPETYEIFRARMGVHADWLRPGMIIRPGREDWIKHLVGLDPLYILDQNLDLLKPALESFPEPYQARLRKYLIDERSDQPLLKRVPDDQIGLCLVYYFFNFRPMEVIKQYLAEIFTKLRPGGMLFLTFNDCDHEKAVKLAEQHFCCYTPGSLVRDLAQSLGYDVVFEHDIDGANTWLELRKPGDFSTMRGGQAITRVLPIL
jgi:hypothetical protein